MNENKLTVKLIGKNESGDIKLKNDGFRVFGRLIPAYTDRKWSYTEEIFPEDRCFDMRFPDEDYEFSDMKDRFYFIGAYINGECVGLAVLQRDMFKYLYLYDLKVKRGFRGRGAGSAMMEFAFGFAVENGFKGIRAICQDNNLSACRFYLKNGFEIGGFDCRVYDGTAQEGKADIIFYK